MPWNDPACTCADPTTICPAHVTPPSVLTVADLLAGCSCALLSFRGLPGSDPGQVVVNLLCPLHGAPLFRRKEEPHG